jgi:hypothetical protein
MSLRRFALYSALFVLAGTASCIYARAGDPAAIQQALNSQFKLTTVTADRSDIVTPGDVVVIHKPGLLMYAVASPMPPSNTYKNGKIGQGWGGFGKDMLITMAAPGGGTANDYPHRPFAPEEKCWVTGIQVQKDGVLFQLYSDPYDGVRYYANLKIPFPNKREVPSVDTAMQTVAEALTVVPSDNQGGQAGQPAQAQAGPSPDQNSLPTFQGTYFRKDKPSDSMVLGANGAFSLVQKGKPYEGNYTVEGEVLTVWGPKIPGRQRSRLVGNVITDPGGTIWEKPVETQNPAPVVAEMPATVTSSASTPMPAIAPPPPPADAPPPAPPTVSLGQTMDQVIAVMGQPKAVAKAGTKTIFTYSDLKVIFVDGKVSDVQ